MKAEQEIELYLNTAIKEGLYSTKGNLRFEMDTLFSGIDFKNKTVLDIGGGSGLCSFYAACRGAEKVVCLEPEAEGSWSGITEKFYKLSKHLKHNNVTIKSVKLQAFDPNGGTFDVIVLRNSINHLNETACINLLKESSAKTVYQGIFSKIGSLSNKGAKLILCDCSRYNFFALFKIHNPFAPSIEWHKHQTPEVWANLLREAGFANPEIRWFSLNASRSWGKFPAINKLIAYFLHSYFCLTMDKP